MSRKWSGTFQWGDPDEGFVLFSVTTHLREGMCVICVEHVRTLLPHKCRIPPVPPPSLRTARSTAQCLAECSIGSVCLCETKCWLGGGGGGAGEPREIVPSCRGSTEAAEKVSLDTDVSRRSYHTVARNFQEGPLRCQWRTDRISLRLFFRGVTLKSLQMTSEIKT